MDPADLSHWKVGFPGRLWGGHHSQWGVWGETAHPSSTPPPSPSPGSSQLMQGGLGAGLHLGDRGQLTWHLGASLLIWETEGKSWLAVCKLNESTQVRCLEQAWRASWVGSVFLAR